MVRGECIIFTHVCILRTTPVPPSLLQRDIYSHCIHVRVCTYHVNHTLLQSHILCILCIYKPCWPHPSSDHIHVAMCPCIPQPATYGRGHTYVPCQPRPSCSSVGWRTYSRPTVPPAGRCSAQADHQATLVLQILPAIMTTMRTRHSLVTDWISWLFFAYEIAFPCACDQHLTSTWLACDQHVTSIWPACDQHLTSMWPAPAYCTVIAVRYWSWRAYRWVPKLFQGEICTCIYWADCLVLHPLMNITCQCNSQLLKWMSAWSHPQAN